MLRPGGRLAVFRYVFQPYTRDQWLDMVPASGGHSKFPPAVTATRAAIT